MNGGATTKVFRLAGVALVLIHQAVASIHGLAHQGALVTLSKFGYAYVLLVITIIPLIAAILLFTRCLKLAASLLVLSMFGSLVFGVWNHFVAAGMDNVVEVPEPWHANFLWTAIGLAVLEFLGMIIGLWLYKVVSRPSAEPVTN